MNLKDILIKFFGDSERTNIVSDWFDRLNPIGNEGHFKRNLDRDAVWKQSNELENHLGEFAEGLKALVVSRRRNTPLGDAKLVIDSRQCLVCIGPVAVIKDKQLCRLVSATDVYLWLADQAIRPPLPRDSTGGFDPIGLKTWAQLLTNHETYLGQLRKDAILRGMLPVAFWVPESDISINGSYLTRERMLAKLGLDARRDISIGFILQLEKSQLPEVRVPTGWDAFCNPHFSPQDIGSATGYTIDIETNERGAREIVSLPVSAFMAKIVKVLE